MKGVRKNFRLNWTGCILLAICLVLTINAIGQTLDLPCKPYGSVKYKGTLVADGCDVLALIQGKEYASTKVTEGRYSLSIPADDSSTPEKEGWEQYDKITLKVKGYSGVTIFQAESGNINVDINLTTMGVLNLSTWGKIKALFK